VENSWAKSEVEADTLRAHAVAGHPVNADEVRITRRLMLLKLKWHHRYGVPVIFLRTAVRGTLHFSYRAAKIPGGLMFPRVAIHEIDPSVDGQLTDSTLLS